MKIDLSPILEFKYNQISNYEFQYVLLDKDNKALHSPFMCKDYIQDIVYSEITGRSDQIYGMLWKPGTFDIASPRLRVALLGGRATMRERIEPMTKFMHVFENALGISTCEIFETSDDKNIVVEFSNEWLENGPLLSTFTTLLRLSGGYKGGDVLDYLKGLLELQKKGGKPDPIYMSPEVNRIDGFINKLAAVLQGKRPVHKWTDFQDIRFVHDTGLRDFKEYPTVEI